MITHAMNIAVFFKNTNVVKTQKDVDLIQKKVHFK